MLSFKDYSITESSSEEQKLPRIYCDMDGVIADFLKGSKEIIEKNLMIIYGINCH